MTAKSSYIPTNIIFLSPEKEASFPGKYVDLIGPAIDRTRISKSFDDHWKRIKGWFISSSATKIFFLVIKVIITLGGPVIHVSSISLFWEIYR